MNRVFVTRTPTFIAKKKKLPLLQAMEAHRVCETSRIPHFLDNYYCRDLDAVPAFT
jgi:hypothetical protein